MKAGVGWGWFVVALAGCSGGDPVAQEGCTGTVVVQGVSRCEVEGLELDVAAGNDDIELPSGGYTFVCVVETCDPSTAVCVQSSCTFDTTVVCGGVVPGGC